MLLDTPRHLDTGHQRHRVVNDCDVGPFFNGTGNRLVAVTRLSNDLPTGTPFQNGTQSRSHRYMVVSNDKIRFMVE